MREREKKNEVSIAGPLQCVTFSSVCILCCNAKDKGGKFVQNRDNLLSDLRDLPGLHLVNIVQGDGLNCISFRKLVELSL